jgi:hypothetical protein
MPANPNSTTIPKPATQPPPKQAPKLETPKGDEEDEYEEGLKKVKIMIAQFNTLRV